MRPSEPHSIRSVGVRSRKDEAFATFLFNDKRLEMLMVWIIEMFGSTQVQSRSALALSFPT